MSGAAAVLHEVGPGTVTSFCAGTFWEARGKGHVRDNIDPCDVTTVLSR